MKCDNVKPEVYYHDDYGCFGSNHSIRNASDAA